MSLSYSIESDYTRLMHRRNHKAPFALSFSSGDENSSIRVIAEEITQSRTIIKEVESHLGSDMIDLVIQIKMIGFS